MKKIFCENFMQRTLKKRSGRIFLLLMTGVLMSISPAFAGTNETVSVIQQQVTITGTVADETGDPIPGVNIIVKGTSLGTVTGIDGRYILNNVPGNDAVLLFSFLGYNAVELTVGNRRQIDVVMTEKSFSLEEVVVTGVAAGTPKTKLGFSIEKISSERIQVVPATNPAAALQGKVAGVRVTQTSGAPGSSSDIQLRGVKTIFGTSNPLFIIDGILTEGGITDINIEDVESIEVLKGAAASSLYGSRAANGVVSVITKRGTGLKPGEKMEVTFRTELGASKLGFVPERSNSTNYVIDKNEVKWGTVKPNRVIDNPYPVIYDHIKDFFNPGSYFTTHLALKGSTERMNIYTALQTTDESGIIKMVEGNKRTNVRLNVDYRISDKVTFTTSNLFARTSNDNRASGAFGSLWRADRAANLLADNEDGSPYKVNALTTSTGTVNPLYNIANTINNSTSERIISFFGLKYNPVDYLTFSASYGTVRSNSESFYLSPKGKLRYDRTPDLGSISRSMSKSLEETVTIDGMFQKKYGDFNQRLKLQFLYEASDDLYLSGSSYNLGVGGFNITTLDLGKVKYNGSGKYRTVAYNYAALYVLDYKDKYIFDGLIRRDASSLFGADVRWQTFYRLSGAWRITEDVQMEGIDEWKLRASYGVAGLRPPYEAQYETYALNSGVPGNQETLGNRNLKPAFSKELEIGTDIAFLKQFNFSINYSIANNTDQILKVPVTPLSGAAFQWQNAGTIQTKVFEASFNAKLINTKDWFWEAGLTFDKLSQMITKLNCQPYMLDGTRFRIEEGIPFGMWYSDKFATSLDEVKNQVPAGRSVEDIFVVNNQGFVVRRSQIGTVDEVPVKITDNNGNPIAQKPDKSMIPNYNLNLNTTFSWKKLSVYMLFGYQNGGTTYNHAIRYTTDPGIADQAGKPWNEVKAELYYANSGQTGGILGWDNNVLLFDATFLKMRELSISYDFKIPSYEKYVKNVRLSFIGRNLFNLTKYPGFDPEGVWTNRSKGVDTNAFRYDSNDSYPLYRTFSGSIAITF